jgi:hypothetical protein
VDGRELQNSIMMIVALKQTSACGITTLYTAVVNLFQEAQVTQRERAKT